MGLRQGGSITQQAVAQNSKVRREFAKQAGCGVWLKVLVHVCVCENEWTLQGKSCSHNLEGLGEQSKNLSICLTLSLGEWRNEQRTWEPLSRARSGMCILIPSALRFEQKCDPSAPGTAQEAGPYLWEFDLKYRHAGQWDMGGIKTWTKGLGAPPFFSPGISFLNFLDPPSDARTTHWSRNISVATSLATLQRPVSWESKEKGKHVRQTWVDGFSKDQLSLLLPSNCYWEIQWFPLRKILTSPLFHWRIFFSKKLFL